LQAGDHAAVGLGLGAEGVALGEKPVEASEEVEGGRIGVERPVEERHRLVVGASLVLGDSGGRGQVLGAQSPLRPFGQRQQSVDGAPPGPPRHLQIEQGVQDLVRARHQRQPILEDPQRPPAIAQVVLVKPRDLCGQRHPARRVLGGAQELLLVAGRRGRVAVF
jgi:hypothetical protein